MQFTKHLLPRGRGDAASAACVAQISDLHLKGVEAQHEEIAAEVVRRSSDVIVITGDAIDSPDALPVLEDFLALLPYNVPKFAIPGNWEHWGRVDLARLGIVYERANGDLLVNRSVEHGARGDTIRISGLDDLVGGHPDPSVALAGGDGSGLHMLLAHCPAMPGRPCTCHVAWALRCCPSGSVHGPR